MDKEIVVSVTFKDLNWMDELNNIKKTIYRKGTPLQNDNEIKIEPNKGVAEHTYFYHIYNNYDNLSDITFFVQDYPFDHWNNLIDVINNNIWQEKNDINIKNGYYGFHNNTIWELTPSEQFKDAKVLSCFSDASPQHSFPKNFGVDMYWYMLFLSPKPNKYEFVPGTHFVINKEYIKNRSREFYKEIMDLLIINPNLPHLIERLHCYIFDSRFKTKI